MFKIIDQNFSIVKNSENIDINLNKKADLENGKVPLDQLGDGTTNADKYLDGSANWSIPPGGGGGTGNSYFPAGW